MGQSSGTRPHSRGIGMSIAQAQQQAALPVEPLLSQDDFARVLNIGRRTFARLRSAGKIPAPDLIVGVMPRWRPETVRTWLESQARSN
jgi:predicted DNA-binding transcriptional regulator AlpA